MVINLSAYGTVEQAIYRTTNSPNAIDKVLIILHSRDIVIVCLELHIRIYVTETCQHFTYYQSGVYKSSPKNFHQISSMQLTEFQ